MSARITRNRMGPSVGKISARFRNLPKEAYRYWRGVTPKKSGNARRKTRLSGTEIQARYPYAKRLDEGWSRQAPDGMFAPTVKHIQRITKRYMRK